MTCMIVRPKGVFPFCCCVSAKTQNIVTFKVQNSEISVILASQDIIHMSSWELPDQKSGRFPTLITSFFSSSILPVLRFCLFSCLNIIHQLMHRGLGAFIFPVFQRFKFSHRLWWVLMVTNLWQCEAKTQGIKLWIANILFNLASPFFFLTWNCQVSESTWSTFSFATKATQLKL